VSGPRRGRFASGSGTSNRYIFAHSGRTIAPQLCSGSRRMRIETTWSKAGITPALAKTAALAVTLAMLSSQTAYAYCTAPSPPSQYVVQGKPTLPVKPYCLGSGTCAEADIERYNSDIETYNRDIERFKGDVEIYINSLNAYIDEVSAYAKCAAAEIYGN
jgi:hypothetical protein